MAVNRQSSWTDTTEVQVRTGATRVKGVEVFVQNDSAAEVYVQLFNVANPTPGTTAPNAVIPIPPVTRDNSRMRKVIFAGGLYFNTALSWFISTTHDGATAPTGNDLPQEARLFYEPV